jgi:hypothetical protein
MWKETLYIYVLLQVGYYDRKVPKVRYTSAATRMHMQLRPNSYFSASLRHFFSTRQWLLIVTMYVEVMSISFQNAFD